MNQEKSSTQYPAIFHIGIPRSGTTTIRTVLSQDSRINLCQRCLIQTPQWYNNIDLGVKHDSVNVLSDETIVKQDGNHCYFMTTLERISRIAPDAQIVVTLREQRSWLLSRYKFGIGKGTISSSFKDWLVSPQGVDFLSIASYSTLYKAITLFFPKENIHLLLFEVMKNEYERFFNDLYQILGLSIQNLEPVAVNASFSAEVLVKKRSLNRLPFMSHRPGTGQPNLFFRVQHRFIRELMKFAFRSSSGASSVKKQPSDIIWGDTPFFKAIEKDFRISNAELQSLYDINLESYGYLI